MEQLAREIRDVARVRGAAVLVVNVDENQDQEVTRNWDEAVEVGRGMLGVDSWVRVREGKGMVGGNVVEWWEGWEVEVVISGNEVGGA